MDLFERIRCTVESAYTHGTSMPFAAYSDRRVYEAEQKRIFHSDWIFVCNAHVIGNPGDRFAVSIAGEPVVVVRGKDGELRAMSNACRHRGTPLADEGTSHGASLVCPYHSWNYSDDGQLRGVPYPGGAKIDKDAHCLPRFALTEYYGLVFVNVDGEAPPLEHRFKGLERYLEAFEVDQLVHGSELPSEYWSTNWKLVMENAMESYHLFKVHKNTLETVSPTRKAFYVEGQAGWTVTAGELDSPSTTWEYFFGKKKGGPKEHYILVSLPPSFVGVITPGDSFGYIAVLPDGPDRSYVRSGSMQVSSASPGKLAEQFVENFFAEDKWICERAFKGMQTQYSTGGQLVEMERVVTDFHQYYGQRLIDTTPPHAFVNTDGLTELGLMTQPDRKRT